MRVQTAMEKDVSDATDVNAHPMLDVTVAWPDSIRSLQPPLELGRKPTISQSFQLSGGSGKCRA